MSLPILETDRFILRPLTEADAPGMFAYASNANVPKFVSWEPHQSLQQSLELIRLLTKNYEQGLPDPFGICFKENPAKIIGTIGAFWNIKP
jgi:ribosomal-protein-alanine N-acetyltransferase